MDLAYHLIDQNLTQIVDGQSDDKWLSNILFDILIVIRFANNIIDRYKFGNCTSCSFTPPPLNNINTTNNNTNKRRRIFAKRLRRIEGLYSCLHVNMSNRFKWLIPSYFSCFKSDKLRMKRAKTKPTSVFFKNIMKSTLKLKYLIHLGETRNKRNYNSEFRLFINWFYFLLTLILQYLIYTDSLWLWLTDNAFALKRYRFSNVLVLLLRHYFDIRFTCMYATLFFCNKKSN